MSQMTVAAVETETSLARGLWRKAMEVSPTLTIVTVLMALGSVGAAVGLVVDGRELLGAPIWLKPLKFFLAFVALNASYLFLLSLLKTRRRAVQIISGIISFGAVGEMAAIAVQASRGVLSHFNQSTPFDLAVFSFMGQTILAVQLAMMATAVLLLRQRIAKPALATAVRAAMLIMTLGTLASGIPMFALTDHAAQQAAAAKYGMTTMGGGHTIGAGHADGGPGLPLLGWSTVAGDMRPAHFLALHVLQLLPLLAWVVSRRRLSEDRQVRIVRAAAFAYSGVVAALIAQALRGQSIIAPDALTLGTLLAALALPAVYLFGSRRTLAVAATAAHS